MTNKVQLLSPDNRRVFVLLGETVISSARWCHLTPTSCSAGPIRISDSDDGGCRGVDGSISWSRRYGTRVERALGTGSVEVDLEGT
jgi:hypothetical protein